MTADAAKEIFDHAMLIQLNRFRGECITPRLQAEIKQLVKIEAQRYSGVVGLPVRRTNVWFKQSEVVVDVAFVDGESFVTTEQLLTELYGQMSDEAVSLDPETKQIIYDNLWDLYLD